MSKEENCPYCNPQIPDDVQDPEDGSQASSTFGLNSDEKRLIGEIWDLLRGDLQGNGVALFLLFFLDYPANKKYFAFDSEDLEKDPLLKVHALRVMREIDTIVANIEKPKTLLLALRQNGLNHRKRAIHKGAYDELRATILKLFSQALPPETFTSEATAAWDKALTTLFSVITDTNDESKCVCP